MAKTTASRKAKGRRLQQYVRDELLRHAPHLTGNDVRSTSMGASGTDILLSEAALRTYPFSIECKNVEKLNIHAALVQAESNAGSYIPLLIFKKNRSEVYTALKLSDLLRLLNPGMKNEKID